MENSYNRLLGTRYVARNLFPNRMDEQHCDADTIEDNLESGGNFASRKNILHENRVSGKRSQSISARRYAFTLGEVMVVVMIIAVVAGATIGIQKSRLHYSNRFMSYASFTGLKSFVESLIGEGTVVEGQDAIEPVYTTATAEIPAHYEYRSVPNFADVNSKYEAWLASYDDWKAADQQCSQTGDFFDCKDANDLNTYQAQLHGVYLNSINTTYYTCPETGTAYGPLITLDGNNVYEQQHETYSVYIPKVPAGEPILISPGQEATPDTLAKSLPTTGADLCSRTLDMLNTTKVTACNKTATDAGPFTEANANFVTSNGIRYFNFGANPTYIGSADPATDTDDDNFIFTIYVDSDGAQGKSILGDDVTKFYVSRSGRIFVPAPDSKMATDTSYLSATVRYRVGGNFTKIQERLTFQQATCLAGKTTDAFNIRYNYCPGMDMDHRCDTATTNLSCEVVLTKPGF